MMTVKSLSAVVAAALLMVSSGAMAASYGNNSQPSATAPAAKAPAAAKQAKVRTPESIQCSKEADTRNLHGKDRAKFRSACKTALKAHKPIPEPSKS